MNNYNKLQKYLENRGNATVILSFDTLKEILGIEVNYMAALCNIILCNKLFAREEQFKILSPEERRKRRLKEEKPISDALLAWQILSPPRSSLRWAKPCTTSRSNGFISCDIWRTGG